MRAIPSNSWSLSNDQWCLKLGLIPNSSHFACSSSSGLINIYDMSSSQPITSIKAHESSINSMKVIDENTVGSCSTDGIKVWDLRSSSTGSPAVSFTNGRSSNFLSLNFSKLNPAIVAGGTELMGVDAQVHMWDLRNPKDVVRSFLDSHHDDVTDIKFHPTLPNYLMSGSTDGYVNIYDLSQQEEEDALHQVINYASVHSCHFTQEKRISVLSHMETLAFFELNNTNYESIEEPAPNDLGDIRAIWPDCEYVIDLYPGFVAYGANSKEKILLYPFDSAAEKVDLTKPVWFPKAHGEEIVRDVMTIPGTNTILTCGEDGFIRSWELPYNLNSPASFYDGSAKEEMEDVIEEIEGEKKVKKDKKDKKDKKEKKEKKEKKDKKDKKDKKSKKEKKENKEKKSKSDVRFKPY
ncbi:uncharacterized WD repeat-containing protein [[Candida] railenensis]|uniref:Uncharacterized WD repeat-containing protein n=1 Tax=[Candida] railenensis TaxID=45579 RepID=A0A9P0QU13_9ASCO|nr:uncharacterized WD repeat-containing protein [[Candida] railenensis]